MDDSYMSGTSEFPMVGIMGVSLLDYRVGRWIRARVGTYMRRRLTAKKCHNSTSLVLSLQSLESLPWPLKI